MFIRWKQGRQPNCSYDVCKLYENKRFCFDIHLIRMRKGDEIPVHLDVSPVKGKTHMRCNIILKKAKVGGYFFTQRTAASKKLISNKRINVFASSELWHGVVEIIRGTRYVLSIGWLK